MECTDYLEEALQSLRSAVLILKGVNPFGNTGEKFECKTFKIHAYSWNEEQEWNFKWNDIEVSWYKYLGRGMDVNRKVENEEIIQMYKECIKELMK